MPTIALKMMMTIKPCSATNGNSNVDTELHITTRPSMVAPPNRLLSHPPGNSDNTYP